MSDMPMSRASRISRRSRRFALGGGLVVLVLPAMLGCQDPLFTDDSLRSPFERYDIVRDQNAPAFLEDEFGRKRPNLRGRLLRVD